MNKRSIIRGLYIILFLVFISFILGGCNGNNKEEKNTTKEPETVASVVEDAVEAVSDQDLDNHTNDSENATETEYADNSSPSDALSAFSSNFDKYGWGSVLEERLSASAKESGFKTVDHSNIEAINNEGDSVNGTYHHYNLILKGSFNGYDGFQKYAGRFNYECECSITYDITTGTYIDMNVGIPKVIE